MHEAEHWKITQTVETDGMWHVTHVDDKLSPRRSFTTGLWANFRHPEICVLGPTEAMAFELLDVIGEDVRGGRGGFRPLTQYHQFLDGVGVEFVLVDEAWYEDMFSTSVWYYSHRCDPPMRFPMLQCVVPYAENGAFPWDVAWPAHLDRWQPVLGLRV